MNFMTVCGLLIVVECRYEPYHSGILKYPVNKVTQAEEIQGDELEYLTSDEARVFITKDKKIFFVTDFINKKTKPNINYVSNADVEVGNDLEFSRNKREAHSNSKLPSKPINSLKEAVEFIDIDKHLPEIDELGALNKFPEENVSKSEVQHRTPNRDSGNKAFHESKGITKEQWIKQPYPVHSVRVDDTHHDNSVLSSNSRAPSVRFVTQTRLDPDVALTTKTHQREGRVRDFSGSDGIALENSPDTVRARSPGRRDSSFYHNRDNLYPSYVRNFHHGEHPYYRYQESFYEPKHRPSYGIERPENFNRQRRVIYYATLPEVVRTPPNVNLRERYNYRDIYDNRYAAVSDDDLYRGDRFLPRSMRYTSMERSKKLPYAMKVSTDVNVQAPNKNPEQRTYSEPDRTRYVYNAYSDRSYPDGV